MIDLEKLMREAIAVCRQGIANGQSPFGSVVATRSGQIVAAAHNHVRLKGDPTAHAEVEAIRQACSALERINLEGYVLFTTCEPCPMCASAIHWARLDAVYFGASIADAAGAGFNELSCACRDLYATGGSPVEVHGPVLQAECAALFEEWRCGPNAIAY